MVLEEAKEFNLATALDTLDDALVIAIGQSIDGMELQRRSREHICKEVTNDVAGFLEGRQNWTPGCIKYLEFDKRPAGVVTAQCGLDKIDAE